MTVYVAEDMIGTDDREVIFPNLISCMGIACHLSNGHLVGCHVVFENNEKDVLAETRSQIASDGGKLIRVYMIADFSKHFMFSKLSFTDKARALGHSGEIFVVDTLPYLKKGLGTGAAVARVVSNGNSTPCNVYVEAEMTASPGGVNPGKIVVVKGATSNTPGGVSVPKYVPVGDSASRPGTPLKPSEFRIAKVSG